MHTFETQLQAYKKRIEADIAAYAMYSSEATGKQYGAYSQEVAKVFNEMVERGGKRIRGALVIAGYEMCGGRDPRMIERAATAVEMMHAYLLIYDDIQDRSLMRRGKPTVHEYFAAQHRQHQWHGAAAHTGISMALNAMLAGGHAAQMLMAGLQADADLKVKALGILNQAMLVTVHGQTLDIMQELTATATLADIEHTMEWKTAYYTFLNPLCIGMVLAGAGCEDTDAIRDYALHTGLAFQITDDVIGVFGSDEQTGKSVMDDIREGKQTLLTAHVFAHAPAADARMLRTCLGKTRLTQKEFDTCKRIMIEHGARAYAEEQAVLHIFEALRSLDDHPPSWKAQQVDFLQDLAKSLQERQK